MINKPKTNKAFSSKNCQAKAHGAGDLVECLLPEQAQLCGTSLLFGWTTFFCMHPSRKEYIKTTEKPRNK